jgi:DNA-binding response OmpR family regulator
MSDSPLILYCEDDPDTATYLALELESEGYRVETACDGQQGLIKFRQCNPDLLILDWDMPKMTGLELCKRVRKSSRIPILMLTAKNELEFKVEGLDSGANDYLTKPFELEEFLARVRALLRALEPQVLQELCYQDLVMDLQRHEVTRQGQVLDLSPKEFDILRIFLEHPEQVLSKAMIYERVWEWEADNLDIVEVYISTLRQKLEQAGGSRLIQTRRGVGYLLKV